MSNDPSRGQAGYIEVLRSNTSFRRLFIGQVVSQAGDWFNSVALFTLLMRLGGSGEAVGFVLILKLLPSFFIGPLAGVVADRFNRKRIMIGSDVVRSALTLGFLLVRRPDQIWIIYFLTGCEVVVSTLFDPAKSASIPSLVSRREIVSANALSSASWSVTLAVGAALGGFVTDVFGVDAAFVIDSASFLVSALFVSTARFGAARGEGCVSPDRVDKAKLSLGRITGIADLVEGARYLNSNRHVVAMLMVKGGWGIGGGVLLVLAVFGKQVFPLGRDGSASIGLLYAARGLGAMIGPMIAQPLTRGSTRGMRRGITVAFFIGALFYVMFSRAPVFALAAVMVVGAHAGGSIQWVYSTTLLQLSVPGRFLGRVFSIELAFLTLTMSASTYFTGWALDHVGLSPRTVASLLGLAFLLPGTAWHLIQRRIDGYDQAVVRPSGQALESTPSSAPAADEGSGSNVKGRVR